MILSKHHHHHRAILEKRTDDLKIAQREKITNEGTSEENEGHDDVHDMM
jgi:hypothetical protein